MALTKYDWILAIITIAFCASSFGNGANDVANSYATSVAARTLTMAQVGLLSMITEFVGAVALGARVTSTIKNDIIDITRFEGNPGVLMLAMMCAEIGSATWLLVATSFGMPVSTTQTIVGALIGVGLAAQSPISWSWSKGSVSQVAASWGVAPGIAAAFAAIIFGILKYSVLERKESFKWAMRLIPYYFAFTAAVLALFIVVEAPTAPSLEDFGAGKAAGIILGTFLSVLLIAYTFFIPYFRRRIIKNDARIKWWHIPLGPILMKDDPWLYFPADPNGEVVTDHYASARVAKIVAISKDEPNPSQDNSSLEKGFNSEGINSSLEIVEPKERFLAPTRHLPLYNPTRIWSIAKYLFLQGISRDCVSYHSAALAEVHSRAKVYDNKVEHLWTYCQVVSAMIMSIAHGSNDVANAVGPWAAAYETYEASAISTDAPTPVWILIVAGFLLGAGFWFYGFHVIRSLGNRITQVSPSRGYAIELGAAITVLLASRLSLPVSTTQCLVGATLGVGLMNYDVQGINWRQIFFIFSSWVLTLPAAALMSGLLMLISLNTPHF